MKQNGDSALNAFLFSLQQITKEPLGVEDFGMILDTLCLDGRVERVPEPGGEDKFALPALPMMETTALTSMPCGVCPVSFVAHVSVCLRVRFEALR